MTDLVLEHGLIGALLVAVSVLATVVVVLYRAREQANERHEKALQAVQQARIDELRQVTQALAEVTAALEAFNDRQQQGEVTGPGRGGRPRG